MSKLTLDEAIKHCLEVAEQNETQADKIGRQFIGSAMDKRATDCRECAADHRQLAEWLTDYKELKNSIGAVKLSNMKEALELIQAYKAENATLREENKVLMQEHDRLIKEKGELLSKVSGGDVLRICQLEEQLEKAKRLLKAAVPIINNTFPETGSCWGCANHDEAKDECKGGAFEECSEVCKWEHADEALKLIES